MTWQCMSQRRKGADSGLPAWPGEAGIGQAVDAPPAHCSLQGEAAVAAVAYAASARAFYPAAALLPDADAAAAPVLHAAAQAVHHCAANAAC